MRFVGLVAAAVTRLLPVLQRQHVSSSSSSSAVKTTVAAASVLATVAATVSLVIAEESESSSSSVQAPPAAAVPAADKGDCRGSIRDRMLLNYENRVREMSSPQKVFEYFASVEENGVYYMTPQDFVHSIIPFAAAAREPSTTSGTTAKRPRPPREELAASTSSFFRLIDDDGDGLVSFDEYMFFITLLSIPLDDFSIAFKMFDLDGNGVVDRDEFRAVISAMRRRSPSASQMNNLAPKNVVPANISKLLFPTGEPLKFDKFYNFVNDLHNEVLRLEFDSHDTNKSGFISPHSFALSLVGAVEARYFSKYLDRLEKLREESERSGMENISWDQFREFHHMLRYVDDISKAVRTFTDCGRDLSKATLKRAARAVAGVQLSDVQVDILFYVFDTDGDGKLNANEFQKVLKKRKDFGLNKQRDFGFVHTAQCMFNCVRDSM